MSREVSPEDFSDDQLTRIFDTVERIIWTADSVPKWVEEQAEAFSQAKPRPTPDELRQHISHAVKVAKGWDHPDDPKIMLHSAIKSYYLLAWIDHLQAHADKHRADPTLGYRVSFTPQFSGGRDSP